MASKSAELMPGTVPTTSSSERVTVHASPTLSNVTVAETWTWSGGVPARPSAPERAIAKHEACAAARSSSGEVRPSGASVREAQETGRSANVPLEPAVTVPSPSASVPLQVSVAVLVAAIGVSPSRRLGPMGSVPERRPIIRGELVYLRAVG